MQRNFYEQNPHLDPDAKKKEGEVKVDSRPENGKQAERKDDDFGDYIDYEEIKE